MRKCRFCALSAGRDFCHKVYEDKYAFIFMDKTPVNNGHMLAVPKKHVPNFEDLDEKTYTHIMRLVRAKLVRFCLNTSERFPIV